MVGILLSYWGGLFSGAMLVSRRVDEQRQENDMTMTSHESSWLVKNFRDPDFMVENNSYNWLRVGFHPPIYIYIFMCT